MDYVASLVVDAYVGARSFAGLYNKPDSGKIIQLDKIVCTHSYSDTSGFDLRYTTNSIGTKRDVVRNKVVGDAESLTSEVYWGNCIAGELPPNANILYEMWPGTRFKDGIYEFKKPFIIKPGRQATLCAAHDATYLVCTFEFTEVPA